MAKLGWFPTPYLDELIYSIIARYFSGLGLQGDARLTQELLGKSVITVPFDFAKGLSHLMSMMPCRHNFHLEQWVSDHTLLPYTASFQSKDFVEKFISVMVSPDSGHSAKLLLGVNNQYYNLNQFLRYCPLCVKLDRAIYGETYWKRTHQLPGVIYCSQHHVKLLNSSILKTSERQTPLKVFAAEDVIPSNSNSFSDSGFTSIQVDHLLNIANESEWLLHHGLDYVGTEGSADKYFNFLYDKGYGYRGDKIRISALLEDFRTFFTDEVLTQSGCFVDKTYMRIGKLYHGENTNPMDHILLNRFLGQSVEEFFQSPCSPQNHTLLGKKQETFFSPKNEISFKKRSDFIQLKNKYPYLGIAELTDVAPSLISWLNRQDREFLLSHYPLNSQPKKGNGLNWKARDIMFAAKIIRGYVEVYSQSGRPTRLTRTTLARAADWVSLLKKENLDRMPVVSNLLSYLDETTTECAVRRIWWVVTNCWLNGDDITPPMLLIKATIKESWKNDPLILENLDHALIWLRGMQVEMSVTSYTDSYLASFKNALVRLTTLENSAF